MLTKTKFNRWEVPVVTLSAAGIRAPQGFSFSFNFQNHLKSVYWTTNVFAARRFYKIYKKGCPATMMDFDGEVDNYLYNLSLATDTTKQYKAPAGLNYRPHQRAGIEYCLATKNTLVADDMRSGKTPMTLGVINNSNFRKILIVCPKTAKLGWYQESKKWLLKDYKIQVVNATTEVDLNADIYIVNYDILHVRTELVKMEYDLLVGDEVHLCKNQDARRSKFFFNIKATKKIGLSGTPLLNTPKDFLSILQWLDPFWVQFIVRNNQFASSSGTVLPLEEVQDIARRTIMVRRVQAQLFETEPLERRIVTLLADDDVKPLIKAELNNIQDYANVRQNLNLAKVRLALNHIDVYSSNGEKLVVFAYHRGVIERLAASLGSKAVVIYGATSESDRAAALHRFNTDPTCQVLIGSIPAASMALNLSISNHIIFVELDWTPGLLDQAEERCSDKLQTKQVLVEYLVYENSLDWYMLNKLEYKNTLADKATNVVH